MTASQTLNTVSWVDCEGRSLPSASPAAVRKHSNPLTDVWETDGEKWCELMRSLAFRDPNRFVAGQLHDNLKNWGILCQEVSNPQSNQVMKWVKEGINVFDFFKHFKGNFRGQAYNSTIPPSVYLKNHASCEQSSDNIARQLEDRLRNGSLELLGKVGEVQPPWLVMPLVMVKGSKKDILCHDERYLNLFMSDDTFSLDTLKHLPGILPPNCHIASSDEKSAYDAVLITPQSRTFFGIQFGGWYMVYRTLAFGWSRSPLIYQTIGMQVTHFLRENKIINTQFLDDRLMGPSYFARCNSSIESTGMSVYYVCATLTVLGSTFSLDKLQWYPRCIMIHLGLEVHCDKRCFSIPEDKKLSFASLRNMILNEQEVTVKLIQKFMGKCVSFMLCVPGAKLYIRAMARATSKALLSSQLIKIEGAVREEIEYWKFIDYFSNWMPWKKERHAEVILTTDSSGFAWGATMGTQVIRDMWPQKDRRPIHIKEGAALVKALQAFGPHLQGQRVDVYTDNMAVLKAWQSEGAKDSSLNMILKSLFQTTISLNCELKLLYIPSKNNPADRPSRKLSLIDSRLSQLAWKKVESLHGPHTFDLMALDSNAMTDSSESPLPHYTPFPLPDSRGTNIFSQTLTQTENYYCFPPFCMVESVLSFLLYESCRPLKVTLIVPKLYPLPAWWPGLMAQAKQITCLAKAGSDNTMEAPTSHGYHQMTTKYDMYMIRMKLKLSENKDTHDC